jgi:hypothetical protein
MEGNDKLATLELGGHTFKRVKTGLDEAEVTAAIRKLMAERDELDKRQSHFASLMKLAEKTISDADEIAEQTLKDARARAESEAAALAVRAEEEARAKIEGASSEILAKANSEAESIRTSALQQANGSLKEQVEQMRAEMKQMSAAICQRIVSQAEIFAQEAVSLQNEFGLRIERVTVREVALPPAGDRAGTPLEMNRQASPEMRPPPMATTGAGAPDKRLVEIEILPPRDTEEISRIESFLKGLPEVEAEELVNYVDRTSIVLLLNSDIDLAARLSEVPAVQEAFETVEGGKRKVQVRLSLKSALDNAKDALSANIGRILERR